MKTKLFIIAASAACVLASCGKIDNSEPDANVNLAERSDLTVNLASAGTKATGVVGDATDEKKVSSMQVFVFDGDRLDSYGASTTTSVTLSCSAGTRDVMVLVNAPSLSNIASKSVLNSTLSRLEENGPAKLAMKGGRSVSLPSATAISVDVTRIASRVVVKSIERNFTSPALASQSFNIDKIYLINVAGNTTYAGAATTAWYNDGENENDVCIPLILDEVNEPLPNNGQHSTPHYFYTYPNINSVKTTRLVIEATIGGQTRYYPINLPPLSSNTSYEITKVTLTRPGSTDPDVPVSFADATFQINILNWTTNNLSNETI